MISLLVDSLRKVEQMSKNFIAEKEMFTRSSWEVLPRPEKVHHMVEDFLTKWNAPNSHIRPLRAFVENVVGKDLRYFTGEECLVLALTHDQIPYMCKRQFLNGQTLLL